MSRRRRDLTSSEWFHVTNRGADRQDIFSLRGDHAMFEQLVADACATHGASVHAYAWMTNHFHLVVRAPERSLSSLMHHIGKRYGAAYNQRTDRSGPVFDHRFHSVPIADEAQFIQACRYVHRNPLAFCHPLTLAAYSGSSLAVYLNRRPGPEWLDTSRLSTLIDADTHLDALTIESTDDRLPLFGEPGVRTTIENIESVVASLSAGPVSGRIPSARLLTVALATDLRVANSAQLADRYDITQNAIRKLARRGRVLQATDAGFQHRYERSLCGLVESSRLNPVPKGA